ncbi:MAG: DUF885 domain-containing protein [Fusicatenibacter sp.]
MKPKRLKRRIRFTFVLLLLLTQVLLFWYLSPFFSPAENRRFEAFTDTLFRAEVSSSTINLHYILSDPSLAGIEDYPVTLGSVCLPDRTAHLSLCENRRKILSSFSKKKLNKANQITLDVLLFDLETEEMEGSCSILAEVLGPSLGVQSQLPILLSEYAFRTRQDVLDYLQLLREIPEYFDQIIAYEREKSRQGVFMNDKAAQGIIDQCTSFLLDPQNHYLQKLFEKNLSSCGLFSEEEQKVCLDTHQKLIQNCVLPSYQALIEALTDLMGTGTNEGGLAHYPGGKAYYRYLVRALTGCDDSPAELLLRLKEQLSCDCHQITELLSAEPSLALLLDQTSLAFSTPEEMLLDLQEAITEDFPALEGIDYEVKYVDESLEKYLSPAFYLTPPVDTQSPNTIYINRSSNMSQLELYTTLAHEGFPGHLYQSVSFSRTDAPLIRHLYTPSGYAEGWATYVESYAYGYAGRNLSDDLQSAFSIQWLNRSIHLCLYSILDIAIHDQGWLFEDAVTFLGSFGVTDTDTIAKIYQYIVETPGNYLKYYVGYLNFMSLKEEAEELQKDKFSTMEFHRDLMEIGAAPFPVVRSYLFLR